MASPSGADPNWYLDSGATDHITGELEQLTMHERYNGNEQIRAANGAGMDIAHVGQSVIPLTVSNSEIMNLQLGMMDGALPRPLPQRAST
jgi:histone deacetylase 1/2